MSKRGVPRAISFSLIALGVIGLLFYVVVLGAFLYNAINFTQRGKMMQENFLSEQERYLHIVTVIFDKAQTTNVRSDIDRLYGSALNDGGVRRPVYFIKRLWMHFVYQNDGEKIAALHQVLVYAWIRSQ